MVKGIALLSLSALMMLAALGNFWFTYGIWPKSWVSFVFFSVVSLVLVSASRVVMKDDD